MDEFNIAKPPTREEMADEITELAMDLNHEKIMRDNFYKLLAIIVKKFGGNIHLSEKEISEFMGMNCKLEIMEDLEGGKTLISFIPSL